MGCISSKKADSPTLELETVEVDEAKEIIGLTKRQRFLLKGSWKGVSREMQTTGVRLFIQMFLAHPETIQYFPKFEGLTNPEDQRKSEVFQDHSEMVMARIDEALANVEKPEVLTAVLKATGAGHRKVPGFNPDMFWYAEEPFLESVKLTLDERYTPQMGSIYTIIARYIIQTLIDGYNGV